MPRARRPSKRCDFTDPAVCLYPWPNDLFTKRDRATETGRRLNLKLASMPRNKDGKPISPADMNRADGFSPGSMLMTKVPGLETVEAAARSKLPPITDLSKSLAPRAPVVVINARTGKRHPIWAEIDSNPESPADRVLIIRPGKNFVEGERYIVALRNLKNAAGQTIPAGKNFRLYRDRRITRKRLVERRRAHFEELFATLRKAGVRRRNLYLAWDFTVAGEKSLTGRALHIRNRGFRALGDRNLADLKVQGSSPQFTVDATRDFTPAENERIARRIEGRITVPCFLTSDNCAPGGTFALDRRGLPKQQGTATFPYSARSLGRHSTRPPRRRLVRPCTGTGCWATRRPKSMRATSRRCPANTISCSAPRPGPALQRRTSNHIISVLDDLSKFNTLADRMQQGFLQQLYLGRALIHPQGLSSHPAFQKNGQSVIDTQRLYFDGNSQGGIMGGALTALAPDFDRAVLGVPGMNYSTLLQRSVDFDDYRADPLRRLSRTSSSASSGWRRSSCSGTAASRTATPSTSPRSRCPARPSTRCSCT